MHLLDYLVEWKGCWWGLYPWSGRRWGSHTEAICPQARWGWRPLGRWPRWCTQTYTASPGSGSLAWTWTSSSCNRSPPLSVALGAEPWKEKTKHKNISQQPFYYCTHRLFKIKWQIHLINSQNIWESLVKMSSLTVRILLIKFNVKQNSFKITVYFYIHHHNSTVVLLDLNFKLLLSKSSQ